MVLRKMNFWRGWIHWSWKKCRKILPIPFIRRKSFNDARVLKKSQVIIDATELDEGYQKKNDYYLSQCYNRGKVDELVKSEVSVISTSDFLSGNCSVRW